VHGETPVPRFRVARTVWNRNPPLVRRRIPAR
jgi:hypothetical protein